MAQNSILLISYWYPNKSNQNFGIFVKRHARSIKENNEVTVLAVNFIPGKSLYKKSTEVFTDEAGVETHMLCLESRFYKLLYLLLPWQYSLIKKYVLRHMASQYRFNIVHSNVMFPCAVIGDKLASLLNCKHVITEHWTRVDKFFNKSLYKWRVKKVLDRADAITCVSETLKQTLQKYTSNPHIHIIPNVIDSKQFYFDSSIAKFPVFTFIAVASWKPFKNPFYFLDALQEIYRERLTGPFKMIIVGKGEQVQQMKDRHYDFEIDYAGSLNAGEIKTLLNKSHVFLHGSDYETFSVIIAEALMCGLPSVVSPYGIALTAINPSNGFVTDNTPADWKAKILACYHTQYNNQEIAMQLKDAYSPSAVGRLFKKLYDSLG